MNEKERQETHSILMPRHYASSSVRDVLVETQRLFAESGVVELILDFSSTDLVDSSGIGTMVSLAKETRARGIRLVLRNLNDDLFQLFSDTGLDRIFTIERSKKIVNASVDLFEPAIDIKLIIDKESYRDVIVFRMGGVMNHPLGGGYFKQQFLMSLTQFKKIVLDLDELTFIDSLSLSSILSMNNLLVGTGGKMCICRANYIVQELFSSLNIETIIPIFSQCEEAFSFLDENNE